MAPARLAPSWFMKFTPTRRAGTTFKGFLDDDPLKQGALVMGVPVLGTGRQASSVVQSSEQTQARQRDHHCDAVCQRASDA